MSESHHQKTNSDFSINRILAAEPRKSDTVLIGGDSPVPKEYRHGETFAWENTEVVRCQWTRSVTSEDELPWLKCTRYKPPKLPRKSCNGKSTKRRLGSQPRIPFTKFQLEVLEERYKLGAYLTRKDALQLSAMLHLPQSRVKIWFQNRRARERKESKPVEFQEGTNERKGLDSD